MLAERDVGLRAEAQDVGVEGQRLGLVVDQHARQGDLHVSSGGRRSSVPASSAPSKYCLSTSPNWGCLGAARAKRVIDDWSFCASIPPKMSKAVRPESCLRMPAHSSRRGPSTGWARYASASASDAMANFCAVGLRPSPAT